MQITVKWNVAAGDPTPGVDPTAPPESQWTTPSTFDAHWAALASGGTMWLAPGSYGAKTLSGRTFASQTTIRSARLDDLATFRNPSGSLALTISNCTHLRLKDLDIICISSSGTPKWESILFAGGCTNLTLSGCRFDGKDPSGYGRGQAAGIDSSTNTTIEDCEIAYVHTGLYFSACNTFTVDSNHFHHIAEDNIGVLTCADGVFRENLHEIRWQDPASTYDFHPDVIQFLGHNNSNGVNRRMVMWRNRLFTGGGFWSAGYASNTMNNGNYEDFLYEENLILMSHQEALQVNGVRMYIRKNTVLYDPLYRVGAGPGNGAPSAGIAIYGGTGHVVSDNLASAVPANGGGVTATNNRTLQHADYATWLVGPIPSGAPLTEAVMAAKPGNAIYTSVQGAQFTRPLDPVPTFPTLPWAASFTPAWQQFSGTAWLERASDLTGMPANVPGLLYAQTVRLTAAAMTSARAVFYPATATNRLIQAEFSNARPWFGSENNANVFTWDGQEATFALIQDRAYLCLWSVDPAGVGSRSRVIDLTTGSVVVSLNDTSTGTMGGPSAGGWAIGASGLSGVAAFPGQLERVQLWVAHADAGSATVQGYFHDAGALKDPSVAIAALGTPIVSIVGANLQTGTNAGTGGNFTKDGAGGIAGTPIVNLMPSWSQEPENSAWTRSDVAVNVSGTEATPYGDGAFARTFGPTSLTTTHYVHHATNVSFTAGQTHTAFADFKLGPSAAYDWMQLAFPSAAFGTNAWANYDIGLGAVGSKGSAATASIVSLGGGWYRCIITAPATITASAVPVVVYVVGGSDSAARAPSWGGGSSTNINFAGGVQVELGASASAYQRVA